MVAAHRAIWRAVSFAVFLLVVLGFGAHPAAAYHVGTVTPVSLHVSETVVLPMNHYAGYTFAIGVGDRLTYSLNVTAGSPIDMYIVPAAALADYQNESAQRFLLFMREEKQSSISGVFTATPENAGVDTVIVDNVDFSGQVASGEVTVTVDLTREIAQGPSLALIGGILLIIVVVIALVAFLALRARRKRAAMPPPMAPPAYPGPPGTYPPPPYTPPQAPPQGPYPPPPPSF